ncbi:glycosyltransferase family 2 protein [Candidatus Nitrosacidococcus sp. I8]|uniref:glycosyltransferase family 2 protein n=1 Tax=Candidatus Nitrosacidococcus sp. I8 TaxID=2942908 RepID=UPI002227CFE5|nr:glycosyltransferase family 2 protein [Candidatus Nitrosacidococcus sp. I8]CAH9014953.1 Undecaprenyl-phosphate 4-deoxy-4-formamido-L-arabinose transferase [Candidatus Nitrosacidococcus sp. I8]
MGSRNHQIHNGRDSHNHNAENNILISIIIVNFNGGTLLSQSVSAVLEAPISLEVIIVDNGSADNSLVHLENSVGADSRICIIKNHKNLGFSCANNIALQHTKGEYILLLNPDCIVPPDTLPYLIRFMETQPKVGMTGCLIQNPDGSEQAGCRRRIPTPGRSLIRVLYLHKLFPKQFKLQGFECTQDPLPIHPMQVDAISGAFMLVRNSALSKVGLMDENYFLHCEDLDWCMRFKQSGWDILFVPEVTVIHYKGACSWQYPLTVLWHKHKGMAYFYHKFFQSKYPLIFTWLIILGIWSRFSILAGVTFSQHLIMKFKPKRPHYLSEKPVNQTQEKIFPLQNNHKSQL